MHVISVAVIEVVVQRCIFILVFLPFKEKDYILISVNCNKEFWSLSSN